MGAIKHKFSSTKPDGGDATLVKPSDWNDDHDITLPFGFGITAPQATIDVVADSRVSSIDAKRDFMHHKVFSIAGISSWTTLLTITPSVTTFWTRGLVEATLAAHSSGVANGLRISRYYIDIGSNTVTVGIVGTDVVSGSASQFRLNVSGSSVQVQVQSNDATGGIYGMADIRLYLPSGAGSGGGTVDWDLT